MLAVLAICAAAAVGLSIHFGGTTLALAVGLPIVAIGAALVLPGIFLATRRGA
jgi:hypothetical protein